LRVTGFNEDDKGLILTVVYGISNCDTVRKARKWLLAHDIAYRFHDFRADGLEQSHLKHWLIRSAMSQLINKRSTSWRQLTDAQRELLSSQAIDQHNSKAQNEAVAIVLEQPTLIKRPVLELPDQAVTVGFSEQRYAETFKP